MDLRSTYNQIAKLWHDDHQKDDWWVEGTKEFISFLPKGAQVLDVGCGSGLKAKYLTDRGLLVTGIDFSEKMIELAKEQVPSAQFSVMDMREVSQIDSRFDAVFVQASLLHVPKMEAGIVLARLVEKIKPGGYLYVAVKAPKSDQPEEQVITEDDYGFAYERFFSFYTLGEMRQYFATLDLKVCWEDEKQHGSTTWVQLIGKKSL